MDNLTFEGEGGWLGTDTNFLNSFCALENCFLVLLSSVITAWHKNVCRIFFSKSPPPRLTSQVVHFLQDQNVAQKTGCGSEENHQLGGNVLMQQQSLKTDTERNEKTIHTWAERVPLTPMTRYSWVATPCIRTMHPFSLTIWMFSLAISRNRQTRLAWKFKWSQLRENDRTRKGRCFWVSQLPLLFRC